MPAGKGCKKPTDGLARAIATCLLALLAMAATAADLPSTIEGIRPSIVGVGTIRKDKRRVESTFSGTGFVVGDGAHVVTNYHVYQALSGKAGAEAAVFTGRGNTAKAHPVRLEKADKAHDLALLRLKVGHLPPVKLGGDGYAREGEDIAFTGFPIGVVLGLFPATHRGIISAITPIVIPASSARTLTPTQIKRLRNNRFNVYQLDATAYPGNSGSPVFRIGTGEVIGVINSVFVKGSKEALLEKPSGISYAIPVRYVRRLLTRK